MRDFFQSIKFRIWVLFIGYSAGVLGFLYIAQIILMPMLYQQIKIQETKNAADIVQSIINENITSVEEVTLKIKDVAKTFDTDIAILKIFSNGYYDLAIDTSGTLSSLDKHELINTILKSGSNQLLIKTVENNTQKILFIKSIGSNVNAPIYVLIYNTLEPVGTTSKILSMQFFVSAIFLFMLGFFLSLFVSLQISLPLSRISRNTKMLPSGQFFMRVRHNEYTEIKQLTYNLNKASEEICKTENLRKDLMANISHDLRTPLTMIKAYAEMIRDLSGNIPEKRERHIEVIISEADRLTSLVSDILDLSKLQSGTEILDVRRFNFSEHLEELISRFASMEAKDYNIHLNKESDIEIMADVSRIDQVVYNLISNAINHTGEDKNITVNLYRVSDKKARFSVVDTGKGIPEEELPRIWERYYKASLRDKRSSTGTGLGLSIVKGVLESHAFRFGVQSELGKGSTFWFEFDEPSDKHKRN